MMIFKFVDEDVRKIFWLEVQLLLDVIVLLFVSSQIWIYEERDAPGERSCVVVFQR